MLKITFDFDEVTSNVYNVKVTPIEDTSSNDSTNAIISVEDNKLLLSSAAITTLNARSGDRITINYWNESAECTFPVIGKSEIFTDAEGGNRLTKSKTVSYRGVQREVLLRYGSKFTIEPFKNGMFKMIPIVENVQVMDCSEELDYLEKLKNEDVID